MKSLLAAAGIVLAAAQPLGSQELSYSGSVQFATGDYIFTERSHSFYLTNSLTATHGRLQASLSIPIVLQRTPWISYTLAGGVPSGGPQHSDVDRSMQRGRRTGDDGVALEDTSTYQSLGLGDPVSRIDVDVVNEREGAPGVRVGAQVKFPLADVDRGFGTGEWDYGGAVSFSKRLASVFVFADLGYWILGDMPDLELKDPVSFNLSVGWPLRRGKSGLLVSLAGYSPIIEGTDPPIQLGLGINWIKSSRLSFSSFATVGLTESTSDFSLSFGWRSKL